MKPPSETNAFRTRLVRSMQSLLEVEVLAFNAIPSIHDALPVGRRWEFEDHLAKLERRLGSAVGKMENWTASKGWKDKPDLPGLVKSLRRAGSRARKTARCLRDGELSRFSKFIACLEDLSAHNRTIARATDVYVTVLLEESDCDVLSEMTLPTIDVQFFGERFSQVAVDLNGRSHENAPSQMEGEFA